MYPFNTQNATTGALEAHITCFSKALHSTMAAFTPLRDIPLQACRAALATEQKQLKEQLFLAIEEGGQALR